MKRSGGGAATARPKVDPEKVRQLESLRLARAELQRQSETTTHPVRQQQITAAIAEIDKRLAAKYSSGPQSASGPEPLTQFPG